MASQYYPAQTRGGGRMGITTAVSVHLAVVRSVCTWCFTLLSQNQHLLGNTISFFLLLHRRGRSPTPLSHCYSAGMSCYSYFTYLSNYQTLGGGVLGCFHSQDAVAQYSPRTSMYL